MTYELAIELKDAGFPKLTDGGITPPALFPTLSELIEACKPVRLLLSEEKEGEWFVFGNTSVKSTGKTPEEAVARLWLAINNKLYQ